MTRKMLMVMIMVMMMMVVTMTITMINVKTLYGRNNCPFLLLHRGQEPARGSCMIKYVRHNIKRRAKGLQGL